MIRILRDFRLIPIVLVAIIGLFVLKSLGLVFDGGYTLGEAGRSGDDVDITGTIGTPQGSQAAAPVAAEPAPAAAPQRSWAQQMFNYPDVTGSVGDPKSNQAPTAETKAKAGKAKPKDPPATPNGTQIPIEGGRVQSPAERAILERLSERRNELEARARDIDMRENLLKAAEKRLEARIAQLKLLEARLNETMQAKEEGEAARFKKVVTMYENMKAKDAARIFDRLDMRVLVEVATQLNPRRMSDILSQMTPEAAEKLTIELAGKEKAPAELPKIEGRPTAK